jgi:ankyrin repeat protein
MSLIFSLLIERNWENVHSLLAVNPDCVFEKDASGVEPLFYCLENYEVTALILNKNTKAVQSTNSAGNTPLHVALSMGAAVSFNVIKLLIKNFPMACMEVNALGNLPLHVLFQYHKSPGGVDINYYEAERKRFLDTMGLLLAHNSKAHSAKNRDGKLPLHFAAAKNVYVEAVKMLTEKRGGNPSGVWSKDTRNGSLPLHCAIAATAQLYKEIGPPDQQQMCVQAGVEGSSSPEPPTKANYLRVIELLLGLYPDSVYELDGRSNSAFILAIKFNAPVRVFMMLGGVQENMGAEMIQVPPPGAPGPPAQLAVSDTVGLPSDGAMASSHLEVANRSTTGSTSSSGAPLKSMYPVHFAVRFANISAALVNYLIELFPDSVNYTEDNIHYQNLRNEMGTFPLHMALENCCRHEVIVALLRASPIIASIRNPDIKLCLHFATWKQFPLDVVRSLHEAFPDGIRRKEEKYGNLPIHYAIQVSCCDARCVCSMQISKCELLGVCS